MATWKRILVEGDVEGSGIISVSSTAPHVVSLGDPEVLLSELDPPENDDQLLVWDNGVGEWKWCSAIEFLGSSDTHLGNSNLTQTDSTRTFDLYQDGVLEFHLNATVATGDSATKVILTPSTQAISNYPGEGNNIAALELNTVDNDRQFRAVVLSVDEANEDAFNTSAVIGAYGIDTQGTTYETTVYGGMLRIEGHSDVGILTDDTSGSETISWASNKLRLSNITLGSTGLVIPANFFGGSSDAATSTTENFGGYIDFEVVIPTSASPFYEPKSPLRVDNRGVRINDADSGTEYFYLPPDRGAENTVIVSDGQGNTQWTNSAEFFLEAIANYLVDNGADSTIYAPQGVPGDINGDGSVNTQDLIALLSAMGNSSTGAFNAQYEYAGATQNWTVLGSAYNNLNIDNGGTATNITPVTITVNEVLDTVLIDNIPLSYVANTLLVEAKIQLAYPQDELLFTCRARVTTTYSSPFYNDTLFNSNTDIVNYNATAEDIPTQSNPLELTGNFELNLSVAGNSLPPSSIKVEILGRVQGIGGALLSGTEYMRVVDLNVKYQT